MAEADDKKKAKDGDIPAEDSGSEDLDGLKKNRDSILGEKKALQKKYDALVTKVEKQEEDALTEKEEFKTLYEKEKEKNEKLQSEIVTGKQKAAFTAEALKAGMGIEYVEVIYPMAEWNESGGLVGSEALFKNLKETKPALFSEPKKTTTDSTKAPLTKTGEHIFTREEIQDMSREDYNKNEATIKRQERAGLNYGEGS